jgi:hypothetical protein
MLRRAATLTIVIMAISTLFALDASALPLAAVKQQAAVESQLTLVSDGCGRGMRFSNHRQRCVQDFNSQPRVRVLRDECRRGWHFSSHRGACVPNERVIQVECRRGWHFSNSRQRCVENNPVRVLLNVLGGGHHHHRD